MDGVAFNVNIDLTNLDSSVTGLEDISQNASTVTEDELVDFSLDWHDVANGVIPSLLAAETSGSLSSAQTDRLDGLLFRLRNVSDVLTRFDLTVPARMERETPQLAVAA